MVTRICFVVGGHDFYIFSLIYGHDDEERGAAARARRSARYPLLTTAMGKLVKSVKTLSGAFISIHCHRVLVGRLSHACP